MSRAPRVCIAVLLAVVCVAAVVRPANAAKDDTILVSKVGVFGPGADSNSIGASISADGRFVAFTSTANNLSSEDNDAVQNIFVRDLQANTITFVSRSTGSTGV